MSKQKIFEISTKIIDLGDFIQSNIDKSKSIDTSKLEEASHLFRELRDLVGMSDPKIFTKLFGSENYFENLFTDLKSGQPLSSIDVIENFKVITSKLNQLLNDLKIEPPKLIFVLTAPFDEEAKTGDGQYAQTLENSFNKQTSIRCVWLKEKLGHYSISFEEGLKPIPADSIPSVSVLLPVANGRTVLSGFQCENPDLIEGLRTKLKNYITIKTPQIITDAENKLLWVGYQAPDKKLFFNQEDVSSRIEALDKEITQTTQQLENLQENENYKKLKDQYIKLNAFKVQYMRLCKAKDRANLEALKDLKASINTWLHNQGMPPIEDAAFQSDIIQLVKIMNQQVLGEESTISSLVSRLKDLNAARYTLTELLHQFTHHLKIDELTSMLDQFSGLKDSFYDFETSKTEQRKGNKIFIAPVFQEVLEIAKQDETRIKVISQIFNSITALRGDTPACLDIHIRPPDTGAFIMPSDIVAFKKAGIPVNVTVHEYKQNYTRRYLQGMVHVLLKEADSVLFFNEKDAKNAIKASKEGDLDYKHRREHFWPVETYDLEHKTSCTVASQELSGTPLSPERVIEKAPNILSFGTIRPGKGFEEAFEIAKALNTEEIQDKFTLSKDIPDELPYPERLQIPKVIIAGDPQYTSLMIEMFEERYGKELFFQYVESNPILSSTAKELRDYWKTAKEQLEQQVETMHLTLNNPYLEIHPWCEPKELEALKNKCKYVCRMDDMGMRNNGSAIISVLGVGITYTKWGCVTDKIYFPVSSKHGVGKYGSAVDLGTQKYHKYHSESSWNASKRIESEYKRKDRAREPVEDILESIIEREKDQFAHSDNLLESRNYKTVVEAQTLLTEHFSLKHALNSLLIAFVGGIERRPEIEIHLADGKGKLPILEVEEVEEMEVPLAEQEEDIPERDPLSGVKDRRFATLRTLPSPTLYRNSFFETRAELAKLGEKSVAEIEPEKKDGVPGSSSTEPATTFS